MRLSLNSTLLSACTTFVAIACGGDTEDTRDNPSTAAGGAAGMQVGLPGMGGSLAGTGGVTPSAGGAATSMGGAFSSGGAPSSVGGAPITGSGGTGPTGTGGADPLGTGGTDPVGTGGADPVGTGGVSGGDGACCPDGDCYCREPDPTEQSATTNGMFNVESYTSGFRDGPAFLAGTIYHPTDAEPPLAAVVICPGFTALQSSMAGWGPFLASHGIVLMTIDTNTPLDWVDIRDDALLDALESLKAENTRSGSPLEGKLSPDRFGVMGWSMGGGGTWLATQAHPELRTGISLAGHHVTGGGPQIASGITVPSMLLAGARDTDILGGGGQSQAAYDVIPANTPKILYEIASADHFVWGTPLTTNGGALGRYGLSFQKVFLEGDERYRQFLMVEGPGASEWRSTLQ